MDLPVVSWSRSKIGVPELGLQKLAAGNVETTGVRDCCLAVTASGCIVFRAVL